MKQNQLNAKQVCAIFLAVTPLTKIITAPAVFAGYCNEKLWQPLIILLASDLLLFALIFSVIKKHPNKTFFQILCESYTPTFAKTVFFIYALFFLVKSFIPIIEQKEFIENAFYETLPQAPIFYPVFAVIIYLCIKGFKTLGRTAQLCLFTSGIGLALILFLSLLTGDFKNLLPIFAFSNKNAPICALNGLSWFNDAIYLLFFIGYFSPQKNDGKRIVFCYIISFLVIIFFYLTFYAIFSYIARTQELALTSMSIFGVTLVNVGRFDYIALFLLATSGVVSISLPLIISTKCFSLAFNCKNTTVPAIITCATVFIALLLFSTKYESVLQFATAYFTPLYAVCGYLLPLLGLGGKKVEVQTL